MYAPLWLAHRDPPGVNKKRLEPIDYRILHLKFMGRSDSFIAGELGLAPDELGERMHREIFLATQAEVERGVLQAIIRQGEFEPTQIAKAAAPEAMRRIVRQSQSERDPRTRLAANRTVLQFAGVEPAKKLEITTPDRVIEQMTAMELEDLADRRVWPARFREVLRAFLPAPPVDVTPTPTPLSHEDDDAPAGNRISPESLG